jgi:hypothetical protein
LFFEENRHKNLTLHENFAAWSSYQIYQSVSSISQQTEVSDLILESFILDTFEDLNITSLLLQTGYLTIKKITPRGNFILNYPNEEVKQAFGQFLLSEYTHTPISSPYRVDILEALDDRVCPTMY